MLNTMGVVRGVDRICGRFFNLGDTIASSTTICSNGAIQIPSNLVITNSSDRYSRDIVITVKLYVGN
jgi:hypothetical protein